MKLLSNIIVAISVLLFSFKAEAHQPDLSSILLVEQSESKWVLQVRAALTAFEYEIENHFGENAFSTPEEFNDLVIQHVEENLSLMFNDKPELRLENGIVKLGHETSATFEVINTYGDVKSMEITNHSFQNIPGNQSALIVLKEGFTKEQFIMDEDKNFSVLLVANNGKFDEVIQSKSNINYTMLFIVGLSLGILLCIFYLIEKKRIPIFTGKLQST